MSTSVGDVSEEYRELAPVPDSIDRLLDDWARQRPDLDFSPVGIVNRLARVRAFLDAAVQQVFNLFDLTSADFRVIVALRRAGPPHRLPQARLMTQLALTSGTISVRVDRLTKRGIVTREPDPTDKRGQLVRLTADGLGLFDEIAPLHLANEERLLSSLTLGERSTLAQLLRKLLVSFESGAIQVGLPLGMRLEPAHVARCRRTAVGLSDTPGLLISDVIAGTPAAESGLARGDLIISVDDIESRSEEVLARAMNAASSGGRLRLSVLRGNDPLQVAVHMPATPVDRPRTDDRPTSSSRGTSRSPSARTARR
ncbi:MAG: MarR family transcriptional regulator [Pseudonocardia sp.]|nr:MarR family transcriptional regulator [Pseudonocardia sp.]